jgi:tape measure domain-containing protein
VALYTDIGARLDERAADRVADELIAKFRAAGGQAGDEFGKGVQEGMRDELSRINSSVDQLGNQVRDGFTNHGRTAGRGFGSGFGSELAQSIPGVAGFSSAMSGYEGAAGKMGAVAGRALGLAFTTAAAGLIGGAAYTLFKGFERYEAIDAATNRLNNLNRTMEATGRAGIDVGAVMATVNQAVMDTPFALDQAFSIATQALSTNSGDLQRFMTVVTDAAGFTGNSLESVGDAFIGIANDGKVSMEELGNQLRGIPLSWLQEELGVTGSELSKMISDGKVGLETLMRAVETNASGFAKSAGDTVAGALDNVQTAVARLGANFLGSIFGAPTETSNELVDVLKTVRERLDDVNAWVTEHREDIEKAFDTAVEVGGDLADVLGDIAGFLGEHPGLVYAIVGAWGAFKALSIGASLTTMATALTGTNAALGAMPALAGAALGPLAALAAAAAGAYGAWKFSEYLLDNYSTTGPPPVLPNMPTNLDGTPKSGATPNIPGMAPTPTVNGIPSIAGIPLPGLQPTQAPQPGQQIMGMPLVPGQGLHWEEGRGWVPDAGLPAPAPRTGAAPSGLPILDPPGLDGSGGGPKLPKAPVVPYDTMLPPGIAGMPPDASVYAAESSFLDARHSLAEKRARAAQLEGDVNATEQDRLNARNDVLEQERDFAAAEMRMGEARQAQFDKLTKQTEKHVSDLGQLGAKIDSDFGISKGLAGIAENITKFVANLAAAPLLGKLGAVSAANPSQGGYGLMGILGARGVFGPENTGIDYSQQASAMGPAALQPGMTGTPLGVSGAPTEAQVKQIAAAFGLQVTSEDRPGDPGYHGQGMALDVSNGSGNTSEMRAFAEYMSQNFGSSLKELIYSDGTFSGLIGDGKNVTGTGYYDSDTLSDHENHVHVAGAWGQGGGASGGSPVPVSVVGGPGGSGSAGDFWDAIAAKESGGNWQNQDTGSNGHYGGLQFSPETWAGYGGVDLTGQSNPANATREQQIAIADRTAFTGYNGTRPQGLGAWEVITNGSTAADGITVNSPRPVGSPGPMGPPSLAGVPSMPGGIMPGVGMPQSAPFANRQYGGAEPPRGTGKGGVGIDSGGLIGMGMQAGGMALDMMAPGAGQAAQMGMKLINRGIEFGGQAVGIGAQGLIDTVLPFGGSQLASNNWLTRIAGGLAGAGAALPSMAGKSSQPTPEQVANVDPNAAAQAQSQQPAGNTYNTTIDASNREPQGIAKDFEYHTSQANAGPGMS